MIGHSVNVIHEWSYNGPAIKQVIPPCTVPVVDRACVYVSDVTTGFAGRLQPALVLPQTVRFTQPTDHVTGMSVKGFKRVYLLEEVKVTLVAPFQCLVCFLAAKYLYCTL
jgi:hypothetical protein